MQKKTFSNTLKNIRLEKKMTLREFSEFVGVSHTYISKVESCCNNSNRKEIIPTIETLIKISNAINIPLNKFLYMCGYLDENYEFDKNDFDKSTNEKNIDIKSYVKDFVSNLKNAKSVTYNSKTLTKDNIRTIYQALNIGLEMVKKNI